MITWVFVPLGLILPDQPNRAVRTRTLRGVGGAPYEGCPYPDRLPILLGKRFDHSGHSASYGFME